VLQGGTQPQPPLDQAKWPKSVSQSRSIIRNEEGEGGPPPSSSRRTRWWLSYGKYHVGSDVEEAGCGRVRLGAFSPVYSAVRGSRSGSSCSTHLKSTYLWVLVYADDARILPTMCSSHTHTHTNILASSCPSASFTATRTLPPTARAVGPAPRSPWAWSTAGPPGDRPVGTGTAARGSASWGTSPDQG
jgi:hypothetical protein